MNTFIEESALKPTEIFWTRPFPRLSTPSIAFVGPIGTPNPTDSLVASGPSKRPRFGAAENGTTSRVKDALRWTGGTLRRAFGQIIDTERADRVMNHRRPGLEWACWPQDLRFFDGEIDLIAKICIARNLGDPAVVNAEWKLQQVLDLLEDAHQPACGAVIAVTERAGFDLVDDLMILHSDAAVGSVTVIQTSPEYIDRLAARYYRSFRDFIGEMSVPLAA